MPVSLQAPVSELVASRRCARREQVGLRAGFRLPDERLRQAGWERAGFHAPVLLPKPALPEWLALLPDETQQSGVWLLACLPAVSRWPGASSQALTQAVSQVVSRWLAVWSRAWTQAGLQVVSRWQ